MQLQIAVGRLFQSLPWSLLHGISLTFTKLENIGGKTINITANTVSRSIANKKYGSRHELQFHIIHKSFLTLIVTATLKPIANIKVKEAKLNAI
jgi:hypothetical protein